MIYDDFCANVQAALEMRGWARKDLADAMGVTPSYVTQILNGYREPGLRVLETVANALKIEADVLIRKKPLRKPISA